MSDADVGWTGSWAARKLQTHDRVNEVEVLHPQVLRVSRVSKAPFLTGFVAAPAVDADTVREVLGLGYSLSFVANIPRESFWTGDAIRIVQRANIAFGGYGDLLSAIAQDDVSAYVKKEYAFVERGLQQHTAVSHVHRVHDRLFILDRFTKPSVTVVILNEYELTADHVRVARQRYGSFTDILITNPNGKPTSSAVEAAAASGASIYMWGEFLGRLNRR